MERSDRFVEQGRGLAVVVSRLEELGFPGVSRRALRRCANLRQVREVAAKARVRPWDLPEPLREVVCGDQAHALSTACPCDSFERLWSDVTREREPIRRAHRFLERQVCPMILERLAAAMGVPQYVARDLRTPTPILCRRVLRHPASTGTSVEALRQHLRRIDLSFSERLDRYLAGPDIDDVLVSAAVRGHPHCWRTVGEALCVDRTTLLSLSRDERYDDSGRMCRILQLAVEAGWLQNDQDLATVLRRFIDSHLVPAPPGRRL
ncbi:uncharacterized protein LOC119574927 isoform X1 [Penaeus monodon]|uniref:uncharacterized protein LOC119574927 isoform X1 n=1 Tax=Penaeus monodon TaxID=6687 RepID=UPI0018A73F83|nr:uncharacterized protein LOC119574927 isoform X1 [Penaeus monodon]